MLTGTTKYLTLATVLYLVAFFAFASGLVNSIIEGARSREFIIPSRSVQTIGETIVIVMILFMGCSVLICFIAQEKQLHQRVSGHF